MFTGIGNEWWHVFKQSFNPVEKSAHNLILLFFFLTYTMGDAPLEVFTLSMIPLFYTLSNSSFPISLAENGTFLLYLDKRTAVSLT